MDGKLFGQVMRLGNELPGINNTRLHHAVACTTGPKAIKNKLFAAVPCARDQSGKKQAIRRWSVCDGPGGTCG